MLATAIKNFLCKSAWEFTWGFDLYIVTMWILQHNVVCNCIIWCNWWDPLPACKMDSKWHDCSRYTTDCGELSNSWVLLTTMEESTECFQGQEGLPRCQSWLAEIQRKNLINSKYDDNIMHYCQFSTVAEFQLLSEKRLVVSTK